MKILLIIDNFNNNAAGIVYYKLAKGLSLNNEISVCCADYDEQTVEIDSFESFLKIPILSLHPRIKKICSCAFLKIIERFWINKLSSKVDSKYNIILSMVSGSNYMSLKAGNVLSRRLGIKHAVYAVDAIPAPIGWSKNNYRYRNVLEDIKRELSQVDLLASANEAMLNYQLSLFCQKSSLIRLVLYNPTIPEIINNASSDLIVFLYTGNIYSQRKIDYLMQAFIKLLKIYPNALLRFVGSNITKEELRRYGDEITNNIEFFGHTHDLSTHYKECIGLIDIDADLENDVFLSSKIINYISVNRYIISETSINSPSYNLFNSIDSIIQCEHDSNAIYQAFKYVIEDSHRVDFSDREFLLKRFKLENLIKNLSTNLEKIKC